MTADNMQGKLHNLSIPAYWGLKILAKLFHLMFLIPLSIISWGRGEKVPPLKNTLLLKSATQLGKEISEGKVKSEDVVRAYIDRISEVEPFINAVIENRFKEALEEARKVDELVASGKIPKQKLQEEKPLLGVPFTTKVLLTVKGLHCSASSKLFKDVIATEDAPTVALLKEAGGIALATSNSAELGLGYETNTPLGGKTCNPFDTYRTPGGSSGGEAALLGAGASLIGLGNDISGSVRVPAHFTGVFAHKPTLGIVTNTGSFPAPNPMTEKYLYTGPMCRYAEDLITMMSVLTSKNEKKMKFGQTVNFQKLKIYYQIDLSDPTVQPVDKDISQAIRKAASYFSEHYNVEVKEINIPLLNASNEIVFHLLLADIPSIVQLATVGKIQHMNGALEILKYIFGYSDHSLWTIIEMGFGKYPIFFHMDKVPLYKKALQKLSVQFDELLDENAVFFYPTLPFTAPRHFEMIPLIFSTLYTGIFNFLGLPATQCPLGLNSNGMPQGMQIVGRLNNDPITLACAEELSKVFGGWIPPS